MDITVLAFAHARETFGFSSLTVSCAPEDTPRMVMHQMFPAAGLQGLRVALDCEYVSWDTPVAAAREMAIIPPVSGG